MRWRVQSQGERNIITERNISPNTPSGGSIVVVVVVKTLFKSHTLTSSTISWFPRGACELHRKIHNLNTTYIYTGQIAHLRCAMLRKQAYVSIKSMQKFLKPNRKVDCANVSDLEGI